MIPAGDPWGGATEPPDVSFLDLAKAARELERVAGQLLDMTDEVADARTIKEYNGERLKEALAKAQVKSGEKSAASSEIVARVDPQYLAKVDELESNLRTAHRSLSRYEGLKIKHESLRTRISAQKQTLNL